MSDSHDRHNSDWPHGNGQNPPQTYQWPHHVHTMGKCVVGGAGRGRVVGERRIYWLMRHGVKRWHFILAQDTTSTFSVFQTLLVNRDCN